MQRSASFAACCKEESRLDRAKTLAPLALQSLISPRPKNPNPMIATVCPFWISALLKIFIRQPKGNPLHYYILPSRCFLTDQESERRYGVVYPKNLYKVPRHKCSCWRLQLIFLLGI